jgi:predicted transcriptional regulator
MTKHLTISLDEKSLTALDGIAATMERSREDTISLALREWLAGQADFASHVEAGIADAEAGRFVGDEEIARLLRKYDSPA